MNHNYIVKTLPPPLPSSNRLEIPNSGIGQRKSFTNVSNVSQVIFYEDSTKVPTLKEIAADAGEDLNERQLDAHRTSFTTNPMQRLSNISTNSSNHSGSFSNVSQNTGVGSGTFLLSGLRPISPFLSSQNELEFNGMSIQPSTFPLLDIQEINLEHNDEIEEYQYPENIA